MLAVASLCLAPFVAAAPQDTSSSQCFASLSRAMLISPDTGWAVVNQPSNRPQHPGGVTPECTEQHLYWTDNDGKAWREVGPATMPTRHMGDDSPITGTRTVFFLDRLHGWMISTDALGDDDPNSLFYLLSTDNGGKTWRTLAMQRADYKLMNDFWPTQVYFSDENHGWILWHWAVMHGQSDALLSTADGGRSWKRLPDPPGPGPVDFVSSRIGWIIGASPGQQGIFVHNTNQIWATGDGGEHWHIVSISVLPAELNGIQFTDLKFRGKDRGVVTVAARVSDYVQRMFTCVTADGGASWQISQFDVFEAYPSLVNLSALWTIFHFADSPGTVFDRKNISTTLRVADREFSPSLPDTLLPEGGLNGVNFVDDSQGWATYINGNAGRFGMPGSPFALPELLSTSDGGATFHLITPPSANDHPAPSPQIYIVNGSILRFPPLPRLALRPPQLRPSNQRISFSPPAGGPTIITGTAFERANTVWIGSHKIPVPSDDGKNLRFLIPPDVVTGTYPLYVETAHGKTDRAQIFIRPTERLAISEINDGAPVHPSQKTFLTGSGLLLENQVWFGTHAATGTLIISGAPIFNFTVPSSLAPGSYEVYLTNANGKSNVLNVVVE